MFTVGSKVCLLSDVAVAEGRNPAAQYVVVAREDDVSAELEGLGWRQCNELCPAPDLVLSSGLAYWETH